MFLFGCTSAFIEDIYLKIQSSLSISTRYKCSRLCSDRSLIQGTLVGEHCAFFDSISASFGVRFLKSHTSYSMHALQKMRVLLLPVNNSGHFDWRVMCFLFYLGFRSIDFTENSNLALPVNALQTRQV